MGFRFVEAFNVALVMKQYWRIMVDENSLLARVLKGKCFPKSMLGTVGKDINLASHGLVSWWPNGLLVKVVSGG